MARKRQLDSVREAEVLELILNGYDPAEIAELLNVSRHTIWHHCENLREKRGVDSVSKLIAKVWKQRYQALQEEAKDCFAMRDIYNQRQFDRRRIDRNIEY